MKNTNMLNEADKEEISEELEVVFSEKDIIKEIATKILKDIRKKIEDTGDLPVTIYGVNISDSFREDVFCVLEKTLKRSGLYLSKSYTNSRPYVGYDISVYQ